MGPLTASAASAHFERQKIHRAREARRMYRVLRISKHHAARVIQRAWHADEPRRRARDEWLAELARRAAFKKRVRCHAGCTGQGEA